MEPLLFALMLMMDTGKTPEGRPLAATTVVVQSGSYKTSIDCQEMAAAINQQAGRRATATDIVNNTDVRGVVVGSWCNIKR